MSFSECRHRVVLFLHLLLLLPSIILGLSQDGVLLLSFKYSVLSDPFSVLADWNYDDENPCSWNGVMCMGFPADVGENGSTWSWDANSTTTSVSRVIGLVLPGAKLLGSIPGDLGLVEHLRHLDLSGNVLNGTLPSELFNSSELRVLSLADNEISGQLQDLIGKLQTLQVLDFSDNAFMGSVPRNLTFLPNLTVVSLGNNYLSGELPGGGFKKLEFLDLGSNLLNGSLPPDLAGGDLRYLNLSYNWLAGEIPRELGSSISVNATLDLSFNNFTGKIPPSEALLKQKPGAFAGNQDLCGLPLKNFCIIPSTVSNAPNESSSAGKSPPAFAAMPNTPQVDSPSTAEDGGERSQGAGGPKLSTIAAIIVGDLAGVVLLFIAFVYVCRRKKKQQQQREKNVMGTKVVELGRSNERTPSPLQPPADSLESKWLSGLSWCLRKKSGSSDTGETSGSTGFSETETDEEGDVKGRKEGAGDMVQARQKHQGGILLAVDGETELELEKLLKASAYILGATGTSIIYKAVLADGTAFAVRRIGETTSMEKLKDFEAQVRAIAKLRHPNLLPLRGFYWGANEKLLIHDYAFNGSLANLSLSRKPFHLSWEARLRIASGVARCLAYLHEKKCVHGNLKPSNILLSADLEPMIGDLGVHRLLGDEEGSKSGGFVRRFEGKRSTLSHGSFPDLSPVAGASPIVGSSSSSSSVPSPHPYQAPEWLKSLKPNPKWDVYSFGMVLLELISGRVFLEVELIQWNADYIVEERNRVLRMADPVLRGEVEGKEEALLSCFKLGFACASIALQRRPSMKDAVQILETIVFASASSS